MNHKYSSDQVWMSLFYEQRCSSKSIIFTLYILGYKWGNIEITMKPNRMNRNSIYIKYILHNPDEGIKIKCQSDIQLN